MSGSTVEPHDKMRGRDVSKVARGEQAPRPLQRTPDVSRPPPPSSTPSPPKFEEGESSGKSKKEKMRHCYHTTMTTTGAFKKMVPMQRHARKLPTTINQAALNGLGSGRLSDLSFFT